MDEAATEQTSANQSTRGTRKTRVGEVISSGMNKTIVVQTVTRVPHATFGKMAKTIVVRVERRFQHPQFKKVVTSYKKFYAHDEENKAKTGDTVRIMETRPLSKLKRWRLVDVVQK